MGTRVLLAFSCSAALFPLVALTPAVLAQPKPSAQPLPPPALPTVDVQRWAGAYERADRPRLLVLCGYGTGERHGLSLDELLDKRDAEGFTFKLRSAFTEAINVPEADVELVDDTALAATTARLSANTTLNREKDATKLLAQQLDADNVIVIKLVKSQLAGSPFSVVVECSDAARGRGMLTFTFDWKGGLDVPEIKEYATDMAIKYTDDFARRANNPAHFTVQLFGLTTPEQVKAAKDALGDIEGARRVRTRAGLGATGDRKEEGLTEFEVTFPAGTWIDETDLKAELSKGLAQRLGAGVEERQTEPGRVAMRVIPGMTPVRTAEAPPAPAPAAPANQPPTPSQVPAAAPPATPVAVPPPPTVPGSVQVNDCAKVLLNKSEVGRVAREGVRSAYAGAGSPRMIVMANRAATIEETKEAALAGLTPEHLIVLGVAGPSAPANPTPHDAAQFLVPSELEKHARVIENSIARTLDIDLGMSRQISPDGVRQRLLASREKGSRYVGADELLGLIGKQDLADIAVIGYARTSTTHDGPTVSYTIEAIEIKASARLGYAEVSDQLADEPVEKTVARLGEAAAAELACSLRAHWAGATPR